MVVLLCPRSSLTVIFKNLSSNINRGKARAGWEAAEDKSKFQGYNLENNTAFANNIAA